MLDAGGRSATPAVLAVTSAGALTTSDTFASGVIRSENRGAGKRLPERGSHAGDHGRPVNRSRPGCKLRPSARRSQRRGPTLPPSDLDLPGQAEFGLLMAQAGERGMTLRADLRARIALEVIGPEFGLLSGAAGVEVLTEPSTGRSSRLESRGDACRRIAGSTTCVASRTSSSTTPSQSCPEPSASAAPPPKR